MKKCFLIPLAYVAALSLLIVSGLGCISCVIYPERLTSAHSFPTTGSEFESYITPECSSVKETLRDILGDPPYKLSKVGFDNIRDWVAVNIDYKYDEKRWGVEDYWQTPEETLSYGTGDCEDFSILLCSLLRAYGIDVERVYVALGVYDEEHEHAFLIEDWYKDGDWRRIESQASARLSFWRQWFGLHNPHPDSELDKYEITVVFNDFSYYDVSFPWN